MNLSSLILYFCIFILVAIFLWMLFFLFSMYTRSHKPLNAIIISIPVILLFILTVFMSALNLSEVLRGIDDWMRLDF